MSESPASILYDAQEYLVAGADNHAEWWEHLGDAHRDYAALARVAVDLSNALAEYEAAVMGTLARLPNHWQQYRDLLELGEGIREARRIGRAALDRRLSHA